MKDGITELIEGGPHSDGDAVPLLEKRVGFTAAFKQHRDLCWNFSSQTSKSPWLEEGWTCWEGDPEHNLCCASGWTMQMAAPGKDPALPALRLGAPWGSWDVLLQTQRDAPHRSPAHSRASAPGGNCGISLSHFQIPVNDACRCAVSWGVWSAQSREAAGMGTFPSSPPYSVYLALT